MPHFFVPPSGIRGGRFFITGGECRHLKTVRRTKPGDVLSLFDGTGKTYEGLVDKADNEEISGAITSEGSAPVPAVRIRLFQSVPKGDRFDWFIEKAPELGVEAVIPMVTGRSIVKEFGGSRISRWQRLSLAASKQSGRGGVMDVGQPQQFPAVLERLKNEKLSLMPWEGEGMKTISETCALVGDTGTVNILIGPEGGFTHAEVEAARNSGIIPVTLGRRILRSETAGLLSAILVMDAAGEYGSREK